MNRRPNKLFPLALLALLAGLQLSGLYGRSSNQELINGSPAVGLAVDDQVFLRPAQTESVLLQFGDLLAVRGGDTLVTLDDSLNQLASVAAGQAKSVSSTATAVYLLTASGVESYGYDGTHNWSRDYGAAPQAVINARETLVFISGTVEVLNAPHE